nr:SPOR domain-containing protein [Gammaproteobacteria bacterium]
MNEQLKHRLVGAVVLVSVAVIVVPMVLKPPSDAGKSISPSSVIHQTKEDRVDAGNRTSGAPQHRQPGQQDRALAIEARHRRAVEELNKSPNGRNANEVVRTEGAVDGAGAVPVPRTNRSAAPLGRNGIRVTGLKGEVASSTASSGGNIQAWAVQLGSFSKRGNAVALRDRLQAQGYPAFVKPRAVRDAGLTRVYVGPEISREDARQLSRMLGKETKLSGLVVPYP